MKKRCLLLLLTLFLSACNSIKRVKDNEHLLTKNTVLVNDKKTNDSKLNNLIIQNPNRKTLGLPLSLYFYNLGNVNKPQTASEWGKSKPKTYNFIKGIFSEKQSIAYANSMIGLNNWFLRNGQAPVVIDDQKLKKSVLNLNAYYKTQGYFKSNVRYEKEILSNKKGAVKYYITTGQPLFLDTISYNITSPVLDSIYKTNIQNSFLTSGDQYKDINFRNEARRLTKLFRNSGVYHFNENLIGFYDVDTSAYKTNVDLRISDRIVLERGTYRTEPLKIQKLKSVNIFTDYSFDKKDQKTNETIRYNRLNFNAYERIKYNPKLLSESIFIKPNDVYTDTLRNLTRFHLKSLRNFKTINIRYDTIQGKDDELNVNIYLTPIEKYTLGLETELTHSNIRDLGVSGKFSIINRNTFKGAEIFKLSFLGSFFNASQDANQSGNFFNSWEIGSDLSLEVPRFLAPFGLNKVVPKSMSPRTMFTLGTSIQKNIGLDRQTVTALIDYKWQYNPKKTIQLEIFNTQYVRNLRIGNYFQIYNSEFVKLENIISTYNMVTGSNLEITNLGAPPVNAMNQIFNDTDFRSSNTQAYRDNLNILDRYNIITSDFLIPTLAYSYTYNNQTTYTDNNFSFLKFRVANSGNIASVVSKKRNANNRRTLFNIPLAQYFKIDLEYKKFWEVDDQSVFGIRSFVGAIIPYDNSDIPFTKSYFAGGSNDIRAWQTYDVGPGRRNSGLEYNIGSFKFLTSAEYRFDLFGNLKGALFMDAGNIWDITNSIFAEEEAKLDGISSIQDIAVGSGFGLRYDFSFLVFRLDLGFKMHEPYLRGNRWFRNYNFSNAVYNIGINYPF